MNRVTANAIPTACALLRAFAVAKMRSAFSASFSVSNIVTFGTTTSSGESSTAPSDHAGRSVRFAMCFGFPFAVPPEAQINRVGQPVWLRFWKSPVTQEIVAASRKLASASQLS
jgi:hypothetical protein